MEELQGRCTQKCRSREPGSSTLNRQLMMTVFSFAILSYHFSGTQYLKVNETMFGTAEILPFLAFN